MGYIIGVQVSTLTNQVLKFKEKGYENEGFTTYAAKNADT